MESFSTQLLHTAGVLQDAASSGEEDEAEPKTEGGPSGARGSAQEDDEEGEDGVPVGPSGSDDDSDGYGEGGLSWEAIMKSMQVGLL